MKFIRSTALLSIIAMVTGFGILGGCMKQDPASRVATSGIDISLRYPGYWCYDGKPVLLLGGSDEDNLFQMPDLEAHLDLLAEAGGNYVRNTMSSRDSENLWPFRMDTSTGKYNLRQWNGAYWDRFGRFLEMTYLRDIVVQVEVWATFDFYREPWLENPFNPAMNVNYSADRTDLPVEVPTHPTWCDNPFFWSVPFHRNNMPVLEYQQRFVDKLLSFTLEYDHVLYCIDNETSVTSEWGRFWSKYIRERAAELGKTIHVTEMWDPWDLDHISHRETFDHPELYSFVEISQNNHLQGQDHWDNGLRQMKKLGKAGNLRPANNVKIYGADGGRHGGGTHDGIEKFIRGVLFGSASVRFHRPTSGLGLSDTAQAVIRSLREATGRIRFFEARPRNDLLTDRGTNEAYCRAIAGEEYLVYLPDTGSVGLDVEWPGAVFSVSRLAVLTGEWTDLDLTTGDGILRLETGGKHRIFLIK